MSRSTPIIAWVKERPVLSAAAVLAVLLVAFPLILLKGGDDPKSSVAAPAAAGPSKEVVGSVAPPTTLDDGDRRLVGKPKDPFARSGESAPEEQQSASTPVASPIADAAATKAAATATKTGDATATDAKSKSNAAESDERPPVQRYYVVDVSFGRPGKSQAHSNVPRLQVLPAGGTPQVMFFGVFNGGRSAGFLVNRGSLVKASSCAGRQSNCELVRLRPGRVARIARRGSDGTFTTYELKVQRIHKVLTRNAVAARKARARVSRTGRCMLSTAGNAFGTYLMNPADGSFRAAEKDKGACKGIKAVSARTASVFGSARTAPTP